MTDPNSFKFDVRVRERMLNRGVIGDDDVKRHLESLVDCEAQAETVEQAQPALGIGQAVSNPALRPTSSVGAAGPATDEDMEAS